MSINTTNKEEDAFMISNFTFCFILLILVVFYAIKNHNKYLNSIRELKLLEIQLNTKISAEEANNLLDDFISETFNDYIINAFDYIQKTYITSEDEVKIRSNVIDMVAERLSPYMYQKLSVYYNEKSIPDIIAVKVYQVVTMYVMNHNQIKSSKEEL